MGKSTSFGRVEVVLTKPNGERIEVEIGENGLVYIDVEADHQCTSLARHAKGSFPIWRRAFRFLLHVVRSYQVHAYAWSARGEIFCGSGLRSLYRRMEQVAQNIVGYWQLRHNGINSVHALFVAPFFPIVHVP